MAEISNYRVESSPHKVGNQSVRRIMLDVIIALLPCVVCGVVFYGLYSLMLVAICVVTCFASEQIFNLIRKKPITTDLSAIVTGIILGLNLPPRVEWYIPIIGGVFAIVIVKMLFGGIGKNFANPAATARVFLLLAYGSMGTQYIAANVGNMLLGDVATSATFLSGGVAVLKSSFLGVEGYWGQVLQLLFGYIGGSIGETCALAIIVGAVYLIIRRVIDWKIPVVYIATSALMVLIFYQSASQILLQLLSGGLMFGAVFMATDYSTSPKWEYNRILYAVGLGFLTVLIRRFGAYPEGVSLAILIMNIFVPLMDRYIMPVRFGQTNKNGKLTLPIFKYAMLILCAVGVLSFVIATPIVAVKEANAPKYQTLNGAINYAHVQSIQKETPANDYLITVKGIAGIPYETGEGTAIYEQNLEYVIRIDGETYKIEKIETVTESTMGYVLNKELFVGKNLLDIQNLTDSDLTTSATYTAKEFKEMAIESYHALNDVGVGLSGYTLTKEYEFVKKASSSLFYTKANVYNVQGQAVLADQGNYAQPLEYNVLIKDGKVIYIGAIKQSTWWDPPSDLSLFLGKTKDQINGLVESDLQTGSTYTNSQLKEMILEVFEVDEVVGGAQ